ncbi:MAG TPA: hypothetical protein VKR82_05970 [Candidatus Acidoferrales bacterium]|nr:hypothetical protein [Candidatus Acidoferrales bacterium]
MTVNYESYSNLITLEDAGKTEEALAELRKLASTSNSPEDHSFVTAGMVRCLIVLGRIDEAKDCVEKSYALIEPDNPQYAYIMFADASIEDALGNFGLALNLLDLILQKYPAVATSPEYESLGVGLQGLRGVFLVEERRFSEARPLLEAAVSKGYWIDRTLYYLGACCCRLGDLDVGEKYLKEALALKLSPAYALFAHYYLATTYLWQGRNAWAKQEYEWCLDHVGHGGLRKDYILNGLVRTSEALGQKDEARRYTAMLPS